MIITKELADLIINELKPVVSFDINLIANDGIIISSTDKSREGMLHAGAKKLVEENLQELIVNADSEYKDCRRGINLPVFVGNRRIAIIGITGNPDEVIKQGTIVRRMTEILLQYDMNTIMKNNLETTNTLLISDLIHGNFNSFGDDMEKRIIQSGLKNEGPFTVAIFRLTKGNGSALDDPDDIVVFNSIKESTFKFFRTRNLLCSYNEDFFIVLSNHKISKLYRIMVEFKSNIEEIFNLSIICSIGNERSDYREIGSSYSEAILLSTHLPANLPGIYKFDAAVLSILIDQIPESTKNSIFYKTFGSCTETEIAQFCDFIITYFECNGSLKAISECTYFHKNTVQYKISKIKKKTNLDIRNFHDLFILYTAAIYNSSKP
ncbi:MAG: sugar diacid recognition domain-containing protein [Firmicutes bacterium]|nr:sugar diacid recognition domain-containing protein [Bacillota bacterium]